jgi:hypothetical protein
MSQPPDLKKLLSELEQKVDELPMHIYIMIWTTTEMNERFKNNSQNPEFVKICYPHTAVPLFDEHEAKSLEDVWRNNIANNENLFPEPPPMPKKQRKQRRQSGGRMSLKQAKDNLTKFGNALDFSLKAIDPKKVSPDYLYNYTNELMDNVDSSLTMASGEFGLVAFENSLPETPPIIIPTIPPLILPRPPSKTILPVINAILESLRMTVGILFFIDPLGVGMLFRCVLTLIMVLLDLGRGNIYHAIFTSFGFLGTIPMFAGIFFKIIRDALMLVSPDLRYEMRDIMYKSTKSFSLGFAIWLFTTLSPQFVKLQVSMLFESVRLQLETMNAQIDAAEMQANLSPAGKMATIRLPRIPDNVIPDVNNLYALRDALRTPAIYCDPKIADLMDELRGVPPYALFFDLVMIPAKGTPEFAEQCAAFNGKSMSDNLAGSMTPQIIPLGSTEPIPMNPIAASGGPDVVGQASAAAAGPASPLTSGLGSLMADPLAALKDPKAAAEADAKAAVASAAGDIAGKTGINPLDAMKDPKAALAAAAAAKTGVNPLEAMKDPKGAAAAAAAKHIGTSV